MTNDKHRPLVSRCHLAVCVATMEKSTTVVCGGVTWHTTTSKKIVPFVGRKCPIIHALEKGGRQNKTKLKLKLKLKTHRQNWCHPLNLVSLSSLLELFFKLKKELKIFAGCHNLKIHIKNRNSVNLNFPSRKISVTYLKIRHFCPAKMCHVVW